MNKSLESRTGFIELRTLELDSGSVPRWCELSMLRDEPHASSVVMNLAGCAVRGAVLRWNGSSDYYMMVRRLS